jgi:hypothetical protein
MRTTLTIEDDLARTLKERARLLDLPFKQVVNETLRRGLSSAVREESLPRFKVRPIQSGFVPGIDPMKLNQLSEQLETEAFIRSNTG